MYENVSACVFGFSPRESVSEVKTAPRSVQRFIRKPFSDWVQNVLESIEASRYPFCHDPLQALSKH